MTFLFAVHVALAGYGDVDADGYPSTVERAVHLWTNAARVDPEAFEADYADGGCSTADFSEDELTPKPPVTYDRNLNLAARYHSQDMVDNDFFAHESSDGSSFAERLARFYDSGSVGENIAQSYPSAFSAVMNGWMCSDAGHRANIMSGMWTELGVGVVSATYTQDFGGGTADTDSPVAMGVHEPEHGTTEFDLYADWHEAAAPARLDAVVDGEAHEMSLAWGEQTQGVFAALGVEVEGDCHEYYFAWETDSGVKGTFPEDGSYLLGPYCETGEIWVGHQEDAGGGGGGGKDVRLVGCAAAPGRGLLAVLAAIAGVGARRGHRPR